MQKQSTRLVQEPVAAVLFELIRGALTTHRVTVSEHTEYYLIHLLGKFARCEPEQLSRALGPELIKARYLEPAQRYVRLKDVADTSLFLTGMFLDYVESRLAATDYFFDIGRAAYIDLGTLEERHRASTGAFVETFYDLGARFEEFVRVLSSIADAELFASNERVATLYGRWRSTGATRDAQRLISLGVIPAVGDDETKH